MRAVRQFYAEINSNNKVYSIPANLYLLRSICGDGENKERKAARELDLQPWCLPFVESVEFGATSKVPDGAAADAAWKFHGCSGLHASDDSRLILSFWKFRNTRFMDET